MQPFLTTHVPLPLHEAVRSDLKAHEVRHHGYIWGFLYLLTIPGFLAAFLFRLSSSCSRGGIAGKFLSRFFWRLNVLFNACDIAPEALIGAGLYMPHPMGIVIGAGVTAGSNFCVLQHATLGIRNPKDGFHVENSPQLGDDVYIAAGAVVCGKITIGNGVAIGANAVVLQDVPDNHIAIGVPARNMPRENS